MSRNMAIHFIISACFIFLMQGKIPSVLAASKNPVMSLEDCIITALENNPELQAADEEKLFQSEEIILPR